MTVYKVPGTFFEDHMNRHYGDGPWTDHDRDSERWAGRYVHLAMTNEQRDLLMDDAEFCAEGGGGFDSEYLYLMSSAAATVRWLQKQQGESA